MTVIQRHAGRKACIGMLCVAMALNMGSSAAAGAPPVVRHAVPKHLDAPPASADIGQVRDALPPMSVRLLRDTDTATNGFGSSPRRFFAHAGRAWFSATTPAAGTELFVTDGTPAGTRLAADLARGPASSDPKVVGVAGTRLIVAADDGIVGRQLWSVPSGAGAPQRLTSTSAGEYEFTAVATLADRLVYRTAARPSLHVTDGTAAGTGTLGEPFGAIDTSLPGLSCQVGGAALFDVRPYGNAGFGEALLVRTDGTAAGTVALASVGTTYLSFAVFHDGYCWLIFDGSGIGDHDWSLWRSDGTAAGTVAVMRQNGSEPDGLVVAGGVLHVARAINGRYEIWRNLPGTLQFSRTVDVPGARWWSLVGEAGALAFAAYGESGTQQVLYAGDGTAAGTRRVWPPAGSTDALRSTKIVPVNRGFLAWTDRSDRVRVDAATGAISPGVSEFRLRGYSFDDAARVGDRIVLAGDDETGSEPWITDGSPAGSQRLADVWPGTRGGLPSSRNEIRTVVADDVLYFTRPRAPAVWGNELWRSDGSDAGTRVLPANVVGGDSVDWPVPHAGGVAFVAESGLAARVIAVDSTLSTVTPLTQSIYQAQAIAATAGGLVFGCVIAPGATRDLCSAGGGVATPFLPDFTAQSVLPLGQVAGVAVFLESGRGEIWRSDGTAPGTFRIGDARDARPQASSLLFSGKLYFFTCRDSADCALVATDGTVAGTQVVQTLRATALSGPAQVGGRLLFGAAFAGYAQIWSSNGTAGDSDILYAQPGSGVSAFAVVDGVAHAVLSCSGCKYPYFVTDGTPGGTREVALPDGLRVTGTLMAALGTRTVVFSCGSAESGDEPCVADRNGASVRLLGDLNPGNAGSGAQFIAATRDTVFLSVDDGVHGREPWVVRELPDAIFDNGFDEGAAP